MDNNASKEHDVKVYKEPDQLVDDIVAYFKLGEERSKYAEYKAFHINNSGFISSKKIVEIDFDFNLENIIKLVGKKFKTDKILCDVSIKYKFHCRNVIFNKRACFNGILFENSVNFSNIVFNDISDFSKITFCDNVRFENIIFNISNTFKKSFFSKSINFYDIVFNDKTDFKSVIFKEDIIFTKVIFYNKILFNYNIFENKVYFLETSFKNGVIFSQTFFDDFVVFKNIKSNTSVFIENLILDNIRLNEKSYLLFSCINQDIKKNNYKKSKISIIDTIIKGRIEFNSVQVEKIDFCGSSVSNGSIFSYVNFYADPNNWETARFFKHEAIVRNNTIEALKYKKIEKDKHTIDLFRKILETFKTRNLLLKNIQYIPEFLSLAISKISNNHGQNWIQAVIFTVFFTLLFFGIFYAPIGASSEVFLKMYSCNKFRADIVDYLNPANLSLLKNYVSSNIRDYIKFFGVISYALGKISLGYGIVQIVQAFRKFNTKGN